MGFLNFFVPSPIVLFIHHSFFCTNFFLWYFFCQISPYQWKKDESILIKYSFSIQEDKITVVKRNPYPKGILLLGILPNNRIPFDHGDFVFLNKLFHFDILFFFK